MEFGSRKGLLCCSCFQHKGIFISVQKRKQILFRSNNNKFYSDPIMNLIDLLFGVNVDNWSTVTVFETCVPSAATIIAMHEAMNQRPNIKDALTWVTTFLKVLSMDERYVADTVNLSFGVVQCASLIECVRRGRDLLPIYHQVYSHKNPDAPRQQSLYFTGWWPRSAGDPALIVNTWLRPQ